MTLQAFLLTTSGSEEQDWQRTSAVMVASGETTVEQNFRTESRLSAVAWARVVAVLSRPTLAEVQTATTQVFRDHTLSGPEIPTTPTPKGRALTVERFKALLKDSGVFPTDADADQFVRDIQGGRVPPGGFARQLSDCPLGSHLIWSTFNEHTTDGDPFHGCDGNPDEIRAAFGLMPPSTPDEREFVLCVYRVPNGVPVRYPTLADGYAGAPWNPMFTCSDAGDPWGYTSGSRPEVVHEVIDGGNLTTPPASPAVFPLRRVS